VSPPNPRTAILAGALLAAAWVGAQLQVPLMEDSLFWWVPKGLLAAQEGLSVSMSGPLPEIMRTGSQATLPQWSGGLPDYAHPPLWYGWLGLFLTVSPTIEAVHLACLVPAMAAGAGFAALGVRLGKPLSGLVVFALPPFLAQLLRPELDLALLGVLPWALLALLDRRWGRFAVLGALATLCKEPGVLLVVPAVLIAAQERRFRWQALAPLAALVGWGLLHGGLAQPERLPSGLVPWLVDLGTVLRICFVEQGRWLLLAGLPLLWRERALGGLVLTWLVFFSVVGFFANRGTLDAYTHIRYLVPGIALGAVVMAGRWPWMALGGLFWLHLASPFGPEASLLGVDLGRSGRDAAPWIAAQVEAGETVWVGTHLAASLTQPWAGTVDEPIHGLQVYSIQTQPSEVKAGSIVIQASYGEPTGVILAERQTEELRTWTQGHAKIRAIRAGASQ
jgi:hypothetical protein